MQILFTVRLKSAVDTCVTLNVQVITCKQREAAARVRQVDRVPVVSERTVEVVTVTDRVTHTQSVIPVIATATIPGNYHIAIYII
jgi:hypothetical protein